MEKMNGIFSSETKAVLKVGDNCYAILSKVQKLGWLRRQG